MIHVHCPNFNLNLSIQLEPVRLEPMRLFMSDFLGQLTNYMHENEA